MKRYFKKRSADLRVGNVKSWATMLNLRKRNLVRLKGKRGEESNDRIETFISQVQVVKLKFLELMDRWELQLTHDELGELELLEVNNMDDVDRLIDYLKYLHKQLETRHEVFPLNARFLFLPVTLGEAMAVLLSLIVLTLI